MILNILNAFVKTDINHEGREKIVRKIRGALVDMLCNIDSELYYHMLF
jgi:hypothetical protein